MPAASQGMNATYQVSFSAKKKNVAKGVGATVNETAILNSSLYKPHVSYTESYRCATCHAWTFR